MKKTALLLALSFFLVTFLNAQNDCTGNSHVDAVKQVKGKKVNYIGTNPYDCIKPNKTDDLINIYSLDRFGRLMDSRPGSSAVPSTLQKPVKGEYSPDLRDAFSSSGIIICCVPPPGDDYKSVLKND